MMPQGMCNLKFLETLSQFVLGKNGCCSIKELGVLNHLSGRLAIQNLENVDDVGNAEEANLKDKKYLEYILFRWNSNGGAGHSQNERHVLDALQPHTNLKLLFIFGYRGREFSDWVGHTSYCSLFEVQIINSNCCFFPPLGQLPFLQHLSISKCNSVAVIGEEFYCKGSLEARPFRSLKHLWFINMSAWQEWSFLEGQEVGHGCFPSLEYLHISNCPRLTVFFPSYFPSLKSLKVQGNKKPSSFLPETLQMETTFPSLESLEIVDCPGLEVFLLKNFHPNMKQLGIFSTKDYEFRFRLSTTVRVNTTTFPEARLPAAIMSIAISNLPNLEALNFEAFRHLQFLEKFEIENCPQLQCLRGEMLPTSLTSIILFNLSSLTDLGNGFQHLTCLEKLSISECSLLSSIRGEILPQSLSSFHAKNLRNLTDLGKDFRHLGSLEKLSIKNCKILELWPEEGLSTSLASVEIENLPKLKYLCESGRNLEFIVDLKIRMCENLERLVGDGSKNFRHLVSLKSLELYGCEKLQGLLEDRLPTTLTDLSIRDFPNLQDLSPCGIQHLSSLKMLNIYECENVRCLSEGRLPLSLKFLQISRCPMLSRRCQRETGEDWDKIAHIPDLIA